MSAENLRGYIFHQTDRIISIRDHYAKSINSELSKGTPEAALPFNSKNMYQCWVNYAPAFFRELRAPYMKLIGEGHTPEDLSPQVENRFRVQRYGTQILIPGAYLDKTIPERDKISFLDQFMRTANEVVYGERYEEADYALLDKYAMTDQRRSAVGLLLEALKEACEKIYFGEQPIGIPTSGVDTDTFPEHYTLYEDFDLNLGMRKFPAVGKINIITVYPMDRMTPLYVYRDPTHAQVFFHRTRELGEVGNFLPGQPYIGNLSMASVTHNDQPLRSDHMEELTAEILGIIKTVSESRKSMTQDELNMEYCSTQSGAIRNLNALLGRDWQLPADAKDELTNRSKSEQLKKEWGLKYDFEVALELIKRSVNWANELSRKLS